MLGHADSLVGLGGGSPRLVADISAWEVAVAAPSNIMNDAVAVMGPDPCPVAPTESQNSLFRAPVERAQPNLRLASFGKSAESSAAQRYGSMWTTHLLVGSDREAKRS